jgi:hypothetical protein
VPPTLLARADVVIERFFAAPHMSAFGVVAGARSWHRSAVG